MIGRRDPFAAAGVIWCDRHRAETWPTDAAWLDDDFVLAEFPSGCCSRGIVRIVVPKLLTPIADRCEGITAADTRCRNRPLRGGRFCHWHQRQQADRENA